MKKFISVFMAFCIMLTLVPASFANSDEYDYLTLDSNLSIVDKDKLTNKLEYIGYNVLLIDGEPTKFEYYESSTLRRTIAKSYITEYDKVSGIVTLNGDVVAKISPERTYEELNNLELSNRLAAGHKWVLFNTDQGRVAVEVRDLTAIVTVLGMVLGSGVVAPVLIIFAERILENYLDEYWYVKREYYKDPITTSRPEVKPWVRIYEDSSYRKLVEEWDGRY
ncbi:hypothetical protein [Tissierella sp. Yu-01]|uniref:hypothetical protein n=1 Tax=Tissierella sp. Yu-01 TaxID=3035694 RepID=UPI00240DBFC8|nr:hypothetical protein [Tissierella sp. Yu-01]WFA08230.1 hypothetical protein P3962_10880 [Tissierella sp. Yu-01]